MADAYTRLALIIAGALGAYSLGANNIANVLVGETGAGQGGGVLSS